MTPPTLAEALARINQRLIANARPTDRDFPLFFEDLAEVADAARERLEMGVGREVEWCVAHEAQAYATGPFQQRLCWMAEIYQLDPCRMVPARLFIGEDE